MTAALGYGYLVRMASQLIAGNDVSLISDGDKIITRRIVSVDGDVYFVCKDEEFEQAKVEGREPVCIGFKRKYVVELSPVTAEPD